VVAVPAAAEASNRLARRVAGLALIVSASCHGPTRPIPDGDETAPTIRSISVPSSRVEAGTDVIVSAVVEDADTPLTELTFHWSASAGTITGHGLTATWRMPTGITSGVNVFIGLTVVDPYDTVVNSRVVGRQFVVTGQATPFRVHDSQAEVKALARKFLVDLFGNSSVPAQACMVDFSDVCANFGEGKNNEAQQIVEHRAGYVVVKAQMLNQRVVFTGAGNGSVHSAMLYEDRPRTSKVHGTTCGDFELTMVYVGDRWWICESYFNEGDRSFCPGAANDGGVAQVLRKKMGGR
jgi:hypothetical protein